MKKLHKIITLCLALVMLLSIATMPVSAAERERVYVVWTEDEFWDLSIPRPVAPDEIYVYMFVVTKGDTFDYEKADNLDNHYRDGIFRIMPTCHCRMGSDPAEKAAGQEAYDRITDPEYKAIIAEHFSLDTSSGSTAEPETPTVTEPETPETPVTLPVTTTPTVTPTATVKVDSFSDVKPGDWYYEAVMALANSGILAGYADGTFRPNQTITAGELATIMCRIYGIDISKPVRRPNLSHIGHSDATINTGHWAENAMNKLYFVGHDKSRMCIANMEVNRGWAICELEYLCTAKWDDGTKLSYDDSTATINAILSKIPDVDGLFDYLGHEDSSHYANYRLSASPDFSFLATAEEVIAHDYLCAGGKNQSNTSDLKSWEPGVIAIAYQIGLVNGVDSTGRCDPWAPITRAQVVQMLYNMGITRTGQIVPRDFSHDINANFGFGSSK